MARVVRLEQTSSVFEELIAISYAEISGPSAPAMPLSEWIGDDQFTNCRLPGISRRLAMQPHARSAIMIARLPLRFEFAAEPKPDSPQPSNSSSSASVIARSCVTYSAAALVLTSPASNSIVNALRASAKARPHA